MKKIFKIFALTALVAVLFAGCRNTADLDTNQYSAEKVTLASYGPNPVMRGGTLTFIGSNLDKINEVQIPGVDPIKSVEVVKSGFQSEIRVALPVEGPEIGKIVLKASNGTQITTKSDIEYIEPIVFDSFSPTSAMPGDILTLKGDYMNLVTKVEFTGGDIVPVEVVDRHTAKVEVPYDALTGIIIVADDNEIPNRIYSKEELVIGDPTVESFSALWKKGETVTVKGTHLEMIKAVVFNGAVVDFDLFDLSDDGTTIKFSLPETAADGTVYALSYAEKEFGATEVKMVVPTDLAAAPQPIKAGKELKITGKDLDLITSVDFDGATGAIFTYADENLYVEVPAAAKEGDVVLKMDNGAAVTVPFTLIVPTIASVSPLELYAGDDTPIVVKGTDLGLVVKAELGGKEINILAMSEDETELSLGTLASSVGGNVALTLANGTVITSQESVKLNYHALVIVNEMTPTQHIGQEVVIKGENLALVENIFIGDTKVTQYSIRTDNEMRFLVPWCKVGFYTVNFHLFNGDVESQPNQFEVQLEQVFNTIWEGEFKIGGWDGAMQSLAWGGYDWSNVKPGTTLMVYFTPYVGDYDSQIRFGNGSWVALPTTKDYGQDGNLVVSQDVTYHSFVLSADDVDQLQNAGGLVICGAWFTVTKVQLITEIPQEKTVWEGEQVLDSWENHDSYGDDTKWAGIYAGAKVKVYFTPTADDWAMQFFGPHWEGPLLVAPDGGQLFKEETAPGATANGYVSFTMTEAYLPWFATPQYWGGVIILQGQKCTVTKITYM